MHRLLVCLLVFLTPFRIVAEDGWTQAEWDGQYENIVRTAFDYHYLKLGKLQLDIPLLVLRETQIEGVRLLLLSQDLAEAEKKIGLENRSTARALRDAYFARSQFQALYQSIQYRTALWERFKKNHETVCEQKRLEEFSAGYDVAAGVNLNSALEKFNAYAVQVANNEDRDFQIKIQFSTGLDGGASSMSLGAVQTDRVSEAVQKVCEEGGAQILGAFIGETAGRIIGSIVGSIVGAVLGGLFIEDPKVKWIESAKTQSEYVRNAADKIKKAGTFGFADRACKKFLGRSEHKELVALVDEALVRIGSSAQNELALFEEKYQALQATFEKGLEDIRVRVIPVVKEQIDPSFEAYFKNQENLSRDSRKYANEKLVPPLKQVLDTPQGESIVQEELLWDALIQGDARYSPASSFSFVEPPPLENVANLNYWHTAVRAIGSKLSTVKGNAP